VLVHAYFSAASRLRALNLGGNTRKFEVMLAFTVVSVNESPRAHTVFSA
jgi:hypothetical protein